jgi:hypothetical protein
MHLYCSQVNLHITNSIEQTPSWETNSCSATQKCFTFSKTQRVFIMFGTGCVAKNEFWELENISDISKTIHIHAYFKYICWTLHQMSED